MKGKRKVVLSVKIDPELKESLKENADKEGVYLSSYVSSLLSGDNDKIKVVETIKVEGKFKILTLPNGLKFTVPNAERKSTKNEYCLKLKEIDKKLKPSEERNFNESDTKSKLGKLMYDYTKRKKELIDIWQDTYPKMPGPFTVRFDGLSFFVEGYFKLSLDSLEGRKIYYQQLKNEIMAMLTLDFLSAYEKNDIERMKDTTRDMKRRCTIIQLLQYYCSIDDSHPYTLVDIPNMDDYE